MGKASRPSQSDKSKAIINKYRKMMKETNKEEERVKLYKEACNLASYFQKDLVALALRNNI